MVSHLGVHMRWIRDGKKQLLLRASAYSTLFAWVTCLDSWFSGMACIAPDSCETIALHSESPAPVSPIAAVV